jgi:hypothetical protein
VDTHLELGSRRRHGDVESRDAAHEPLPTARLAAVGAVAGIAGGIAMAAPIVIWDWAHVAHRALELPMATTAWLFGLGYFSNDSNLWWPIVLGAVLLVASWVVSGVAFVPDPRAGADGRGRPQPRALQPLRA